MSRGLIYDEALGSSFVRLRTPAPADRDQRLYDEAYGPGNPHHRTRPLRVAEPSKTKLTGHGGDVGEPAGLLIRDREWLDVTCWCEATVQHVRADLVRAGRTVRCRSRFCRPPYEFDWDEFTSPRGRS